MSPISEVFNINNMTYMATIPDKYFDLVIADPPYGIGEDGSKNHSRGKLSKSKNYKPYSSTDKKPPSVEYFKEIIRVSKNQIIWGANHFISRIPFDSPCWIVWDKNNGETDFADCELAYTNFNSAVRKFKWTWQGMLQEDMKNKQQRIHPNEKPYSLYGWLLKNYAKQGDKIFDPNLGSQSSRIAAYDMGFDFWGCELDTEYFQKGNKRFENFKKQLKLL